MQSGRIHSFESMGLVDGPGIRFVVFMQGCRLRCLFCHNPDTWNPAEGTLWTSGELMAKILRFKPYFDSSGGGVTFSGGEPLLQPDFLLEMLRLCKENGIHTAIDTAGVGLGSYDEILSYTDLVLMDIKHTDSEKYRYVAGMDNLDFLNFLEAYRRSQADAWIRAVIIPGINDSQDYIMDLWEMVKTIPRVKKIELLPYHVLGVHKYEELKMKYRLDGVEPMDKAQTQIWQDMLNKALIAEE